MFGVPVNAGANYAQEVYPGYPGLVIARGQMQAMTWGLPLVLKSKRTGQPLKPRPVNNAREDKLGTAFWRDSFVNRRCLVPVSTWAEAEGEKGRMTRTWYALPGEPLFAVAGIWRPTAEWGNAYAMVMVDSCKDMASDHDRMPTVLARESWDKWMDGTPQEALALCRPWEAGLAVERSAEPWAQASLAPSSVEPRLL